MGKLTTLFPDTMRITWLNLRRNGRRSMLSMLIISIAILAILHSDMLQKPSLSILPL